MPTMTIFFLAVFQPFVIFTIQERRLNMANNTVTLTGNMGSEAKAIETSDKPFATFSLATTDSYQDEQGQWQQKETVWHNILVFSPKLIEQIKSLKKGSRLEIIGSLSYRSFEIQTESGIITKKEAAIIASKLEQKPLVKKTS